MKISVQWNLVGIMKINLSYISFLVNYIMSKENPKEIRRAWTNTPNYLVITGFCFIQPLYKDVTLYNHDNEPIWIGLNFLLNYIILYAWIYQFSTQGNGSHKTRVQNSLNFTWNKEMWKLLLLDYMYTHNAIKLATYPRPPPNPPHTKASTPTTTTTTRSHLITPILT